MKEGWQVKKLGEVVKYVKEQGKYTLPYVGMEHIKSFSSHFIGDTNPMEVMSNTFMFKKGDLLYGRLRPYLQKVWLATFDGHCSTELFPIRTGYEINVSFLKYWFLTDNISNKINDTSTGARMPRANMNEVLTFEIPFPPLSEQQRIVEVLDNAFAKIDAVKQNAERNLKNTQDLFQSVLSHELLKKQGWISTKLENVCSLYQGLAINAKTKHLLIDKSSIPLLRIKDLKNNAEELYVKEEGYPPSSLVQKNDILYTRTGSLGLVFTGRYGVLHNNCFKIVPTKDIDRDYLIWFLQENGFKKRILSLAERAAQPDITHKLFKEQIISYPSLLEQQHIVSKLNALSEKCKELENSYQQTINNCDELKKAILAKAFNGEL